MSNPLLIALFAAAICGCHDSSVSVSNFELVDNPSKNHPQPVADALDSRTPLPLLPRMAQHQRENMRDYLAAVQEITDAVSKNDFVGVEKSAARIGSSEQMEEMCKHMGMGAPGFTEMALSFHRTADSIGAAARKQDETDVLKALSATVSTCVACHATYRQQVVDEATWRRLWQRRSNCSSLFALSLTRGGTISCAAYVFLSRSSTRPAWERCEARSGIAMNDCETRPILCGTDFPEGASLHSLEESQ